MKVRWIPPRQNFSVPTVCASTTRRMSLIKPSEFLARARPGHCGTTADVGDCTIGESGSFGEVTARWEKRKVYKDSPPPHMMKQAVRSCLSACNSCTQCNYVSISWYYKDCACPSALNHTTDSLPLRTARHRLARVSHRFVVHRVRHGEAPAPARWELVPLPVGKRLYQRAAHASTSQQPHVAALGIEGEAARAAAAAGMYTACTLRVHGVCMACAWHVSHAATPAGRESRARVGAASRRDARRPRALGQGARSIDKSSSLATCLKTTCHKQRQVLRIAHTQVGTWTIPSSGTNLVGVTDGQEGARSLLTQARRTFEVRVLRTNPRVRFEAFAHSWSPPVGDLIDTAWRPVWSRHEAPRTFASPGQSAACSMSLALAAKREAEAAANSTYDLVWAMRYISHNPYASPSSCPSPALAKPSHAALLLPSLALHPMPPLPPPPPTPPPPPGTTWPSSPLSASTSYPARSSGYRASAVIGNPIPSTPWCRLR